MLKVLDLFSGIGGFSLGLERAGMETVAFCEIEEFPQKVLNKHWPDVPIYNDVRELNYERLKSDGIPRIDVICGGFPCQDISVAGNQAGIGEETRSGLWSECARLLGEVRPRYAIFENVTNLLNGNGGDWFKRVLWDISEVGYDAEWHCIPASELGAHHHRDRVWVVVYPSSDGEGREAEGGFSSNLNQTDSGLEQGWNEAGTKVLANTNGAQRKGGCRPVGILAKHSDLGCPSLWKAEPAVGRVVDGIPDRAHRLKGLGNAVVPQIPELIGRAIMEAENNAP